MTDQQLDFQWEQYYAEQILEETATRRTEMDFELQEIIKDICTSQQFGLVPSER